MRLLWVRREIAAPAARVWQLLADARRWHEWGPSVRTASLESARLAPGAIGSITTAAGLRLPFEISAFEDGRRWAWRVAGVPATDHRVDALGLDRCLLGFGVPWPAAPYLVVCRVAMTRIARIAES